MKKFLGMTLATTVVVGILGAAVPAVAQERTSDESDFAQIQTVGEQVKWTIENNAGIELRVHSITDHWGGDAIVNNEWLLNDPHRWGYGPAPTIASNQATSLSFVNWFMSDEWVRIAFTTPDGRFLTVKLTDVAQQGYPTIDVMSARGLGVEATSNGRADDPNAPTGKDPGIYNTLTIFSDWSVGVAS